LNAECRSTNHLIIRSAFAGGDLNWTQALRLERDLSREGPSAQGM
jgi:hypothetical protein